MFKMFSVNNDTVYWDKLDELVNAYNNTRHSSIKITPLEASKKENEKKVYNNLYSDLIYLKPGKLIKSFKLVIKFVYQNIKDPYLIKVILQTGQKRYLWLVKLSFVFKNTKPVTYKIVDLMGEQVKGSFYEKRVTKAEQETFRIEKVLKRDYKKKLALVKWIGYPDKFNSWIKFSDLVDF